MTPGQISTIRNSIINQIVAVAARELSVNEKQLVVRDILPYTDLGMDYGTASAGTTENWERDLTGTSVGYVSVTGSHTMGDQRYVAIFGVRDYRNSQGATHTATEISAAPYMPLDEVSLIKFDIGGATKAIWDISGIQAKSDAHVGFSPSAVLIPQNASYNIYYYVKAQYTADTAKIGMAYLQFVGVTVEPRGKTMTP
jgi:hypothetical protein